MATEPPQLLLSAKTENVFRRALKSLNVEVPLRHLGRRDWHVEQYAIVRLLKTLPRSRVPFPAVLWKREGPDFILERNGEDVAIEHTEAVSQLEAHRANVLGELIANGAKVNLVQPVVLRSPTDAVLGRKEIVAHPDNPPMFYAGDVVEQNWATAMRHFIDKKLAKFSGYEQCPTQWLLIYDNWPADGLDLTDACGRLHRQLRENETFTILDSVFIIHLTKLVEFTRDNIGIRVLKSPRLSRDAQRTSASPCRRRQQRTLRRVKGASMR